MALEILSLLFVLALTSVAVVVVRRNLRGEHTFKSLVAAGMPTPPIWFELICNSIFLLGGIFFTAIVASLFLRS